MTGSTREALVVVACALLAAAGAGRAGDVQATWLGGTGDWSDPTQWDSADYPNNNGLTYDAAIGSGTVTCDVNVTVDSLTVTGGTLVGPVCPRFGVMDWTGGRIEISDTLTIDNAAHVTIRSDERKVVQGDVHAKGRVTLSGGALEQPAGSRFLNLSTFTLDDDTDIVHAPGPPAVFDNQGAFEKTAGTGMAEVQHVFNNDGTVAAGTGTLRLTGGGVHTGSFSASPGAAIEFGGGSHLLSPDGSPGFMHMEGTILVSDGTVRATGPLRGEATVRVTGGSLDLDVFAEPIPAGDPDRLYFVQNGNTFCYFNDLADGNINDSQLSFTQLSEDRYQVAYHAGQYFCAIFIVTLGDPVVITVPDHESHEEVTGTCGSHHYASYDADGDGHADWNTHDFLIEGKGDDDTSPCGLPGVAYIPVSGPADFRITVSGGAVNFNADGPMHTPVILEGGTAGGTGRPEFDDLTWTDGTLDIPRSARIAAGGTLSISATGGKHLRGDLVNQAGGTIDVQADAVLAALDGAPATVANDGHVHLGLATLAVEGRYVQSGAGSIQIELAELASGHLELTGEAVLGGTLSITRAVGLALDAGDEFTVITCASRTGRFADLDGWLLPAMALVPQYQADGVVLHTTWRGDANLDGAVGVADLAALADNYGMAAGAEWARGDFSGDGLVGIADLMMLADHYGAGAGGAAGLTTGGAAVPEPSAAMLIWAGLPAAWSLRRRRPSRK